MNFTPFTGAFTGTIPVHQFTAKFANANGQTTVPPGTVVLSGGDGGIHYLRPTEVVSQAGTLTNQTLITVPVSMEQSTSKEDSTSTVQAHSIQPTATVQNFDNNFSLQVLNHAGIKYNITPVSMQHFSQVGGPGTVLTVAYPADLDGITVDGKGTQTQMIPVEIQGQDLCATLVVAAPSGDGDKVLFRTQDQDGNISDAISGIPVEKLITIKREEGVDDGKEGTVITSTEQQIELQGQTVTTMPATWQSIAAPGSTVADYLARLPASTLPLSLHHFLKFSAESIKRENNEACTVTLPPAQPIVVTTVNEADGTEGTVTVTTMAAPEGVQEEADTAGKAKKRRRGTKKAKQPKMRPGQVQLTTALDGTTLFCCPECNMAYPDKDLLEQHLVAHKIERRFICDICGAGLKRKEHLDRHKQGHNPERPFICSVCMKGFKRKEHLNLHFVIHSGEKTHICPECGKGFYRKDHLRKHSRSHLAKRIKSEMNSAGNTAPNQPPPPQLKIEVIQQVPSADPSSPTEDPLKLIPLGDKLV
ncbi:transcription factor Sp1-like isoform X2 [Neocloeon triangulifer]|uniref:transcription factor Sp1-like isoform X2 n=1 Tax=Neocloeon triangulifer TaxID=2078957 RepID=UPI00286F1BBD|nr:transcription factor Sp1-like isoform X2 [Neocloeon triangulifer]